LLNFLYPFHGIYFKRFHFIVIVSNTFKKAAMHLESIKSELRDNEKLKTSMPQKITITRDAEGDSEFRHGDGFTTKVLCKGVDQIGSIRGVKFGAYRPDLILPDDIEDDELVRNPIRRQELQNNVDEALIPAGETGKCQFIWIGTILHDDSQLAKMVKHKGMYPEYKKLIYQAHIDPGGPNERSLWPEKWTVEWLTNLAENRPLVYAKEYQSDPAVGRAGVFVEKDFRRWEIENDQYVLYDETGQRPIGRGLLKECKAAMACDLAWEAKRQADYCVVLPGFLTPQSDLLVYRYFAEKGVRPDRLEEVIFFLADKLESLTGSKVPIGMEKAKLEKVMKWVLRQAMRRRNRFLLLTDLKWDVDKLARIETRLQPRYANNSIYHMDDMGELEHQLLRFPAAAFDDLPDALQGLVQILQHPKHRKVEKPPVDQFEMMRRLAIGQRKSIKGLYKITSDSPRKGQRGIPARWSPLG
jgi:muconolactone delta-isomerase